MDDWPERYSAALDIRLTDEEVDAILDLAREVAHATERRFAPLSAYPAGKFVGQCVAAGATGSDAVHEAKEVAGRLLTQ